MDEKQWIKELKRHEQEQERAYKAPRKHPQYPQRSADDIFWMRISFCLVIISVGLLLYITFGIIGLF
ncbi:MAG: hypothetical protein M9918_19520 [Anaerolineae bacterium]|nr:hypothetical protein [Anaerolineae bacterium]